MWQIDLLAKAFSNDHAYFAIVRMVFFLLLSSDCNTLLVSGPDGVTDKQIVLSGPSGQVGLNLTSLVRLDTPERITPNGIQSGGWVASASDTRAPSWIQVVFSYVLVI